MGLTEFLLQRIAEDERHAQKLAETDTRPVLALAITVNHPARLLLECEAKRRIVERHSIEGGVEEWMDADWVATIAPEERGGYCDWCTYDARTVWSPCPDLRDLAAVYVDHPDYDESWRP